MSKIKCPNCNIEIDSNSKRCPFCGGKLDICNTEITRADSRWFRKWTRKLAFIRFFSGFVFGISFGFSIVYIRYDDSTRTKYICGALFVLSLIALIITLITAFKHRDYVGNSYRYNVVLYQGFFSYLVIENKVVAKKFMGILPVKKENILNPSTVCLFLNLENVDIDEVSARSLKDSKDLLGRLPNGKKVLIHYDGKVYDMMEQLDNK